MMTAPTIHHLVIVRFAMLLTSFLWQYPQTDVSPLEGVDSIPRCFRETSNSLPPMLTPFHSTSMADRSHEAVTTAHLNSQNNHELTSCCSANRAPDLQSNVSTTTLVEAIASTVLKCAITTRARSVRSYLSTMCKQGHAMLAALAAVFVGKPFPVAWDTSAVTRFLKRL
jgi:hypothetical protein